MATPKKENPSKGGRPSKYSPDILPIVKNYCLLGAKDEDLARFLGVSHSTIDKWKNEFPEFLQTLKEGKEEADSMVANSLYQRALGYEHPELYITQYQGMIVEKEIIKRYPPDPTSMIFWLKNRRPDLWRDKQEIDHTSKGESINREQTLTTEQLLAEAKKRGLPGVIFDKPESK